MLSPTLVLDALTATHEGPRMTQVAEPKLSRRFIKEVVDVTPRALGLRVCLRKTRGCAHQVAFWAVHMPDTAERCVKARCGVGSAFDRTLTLTAQQSFVCISKLNQRAAFAASLYPAADRALRPLFSVLMLYILK